MDGKVSAQLQVQNRECALGTRAKLALVWFARDRLCIC